MRWLGLLCLLCVPADAAAIFEFHNGFWLNLHQWLCHLASAPPDSDAPDLRDAVDYYRREVKARDALSPEQAGVNNRLSGLSGDADPAGAGLDVGLTAALIKAAPIYRRTWWPEHQRSNAAWIEAAESLVAKYGSAIRKDIAAAYDVDWPDSPIRVDVSGFASDLGAYTTVEPAHITISSLDPAYRGDAALEMLFHEASHSLDAKLKLALDAELRARGMLFRRRGFEHAIVFYTAGEITRHYIAGYQPFASKNAIWEKGWPGALAVLEKDWQPHLEGRIDLAAAIKAAVSDYGVPR